MSEINLTLDQQALVDATEKTVYWTFEVTDNTSATHYFSTKNIPNATDIGFDSDATYSFGITDFSKITLRRGKSESRIQAPTNTTFSIVHDGSLDPEDFVNGTVNIRLSLTDGTDTEVIRQWLLDIDSVQPSNQKITIKAVDFLQKYLDSDYPNTHITSSIFPSTVSNIRDSCAPVIFGQAHIPLDCIFTNDYFYLLGYANDTYTIESINTPTDASTAYSIWNHSDTPNNTSTFGLDQSSVISTSTFATDTFRVFQAKIIDANLDDVYDECGIWSKGSAKYYSVPTKFSKADTVTTTNFADVIKYVLIDFGISEDNIDTTSFDSAAATFTGWGLTFSGGFYKKETRQKVISSLLNQCNSYLSVGEKIGLYVLPTASSATITTGLIKNTFRYKTIINKNSYTAAYVSTPIKDMSQDNLIKTLVPVKGDDSSIIDSSTIEAPFVRDSDHVQRIGQLYHQRKSTKRANVSFSGFSKFLDCYPWKILRLNDDKYGGDYDVVIDEIDITKDLQIKIKSIRHNIVLDGFNDLSFSDVDPVDPVDSAFSYTPILQGPPGNTSSGNDLTGIYQPVQIQVDGFVSAGKKSYSSTTAGFFLGWSSPYYRFNIGDSASYLNWSGTALSIRMASGETFRLDGNLDVYGNVNLKSGGNLTIEAGGDLLFETLVGVNNSVITWDCDTVDYSIGANRSDKVLAIWGGGTANSELMIGRNLVESSYPFYNVGIETENLYLWPDTYYQFLMGFTGSQHCEIEINGGAHPVHRNRTGYSSSIYSEIMNEAGNLDSEAWIKTYHAADRYSRFYSWANSTTVNAELRSDWEGRISRIYTEGTDTTNRAYMEGAYTSTLLSYLNNYSNNSEARSYLRSQFSSTNYSERWQRASSGSAFMENYCQNASTSYYAKTYLNVDTATGYSNWVCDLKNGSYITGLNAVVYPAGTRRIIPVGVHKGTDFGIASAAWNTIFADDFTNVADFYWLDERKDIDGKIVQIDDIAAIRQIKPLKNKYEDYSGLALIDDNTLPDWMISKYKEDTQGMEGYIDEDGEKKERVIIVGRKGENMYDPNGAPYLSFRTMTSLNMGAIRQLADMCDELQQQIVKLQQ